MRAGVITAVEGIATREEQPLLRCTTPLFEWRPGSPLESDDQPPDDEVINEDDPLPISDGREESALDDEDPMKTARQITDHPMKRTMYN